MTYKEQEKLIILEMTREEWERLLNVLLYATSESMEKYNYAEVNDTKANFRRRTE